MGDTQPKILYIDHFSDQNSNHFWKTGFQRFGSVLALEINRLSQEQIAKTALEFCPTHIHLGGSVKYDSVSLGLLTFLRRRLNASVSHFYGDAAPTEYHFRTARAATVYYSNHTYVDWGRGLGIPRAHYMPYPTAPDLFQPSDSDKSVEVVFLGSNYSPSRLALLTRIARDYNLLVYGDGWESTAIPSRPGVYGAEFAQALSEAKIVLSIVSTEYSHLRMYFSNRLMNSLSCAACVLQTRTPDIEQVFQHGKHLLLFEDEDEALHLLKNYVNDDRARSEIGERARQEVLEKYSYSKAVESILEDGDAVRNAPSAPQPQATETPVILRSGGGDVPTVSIPQPRAERLLWSDECGSLPDGSIPEIAVDVERLPTTSFAYLDDLVEIARVSGTNARVLLEGDEKRRAACARVLEKLHFETQESSRERTLLRKTAVPPANADTQWMTLVREGYAPPRCFSLKWYSLHTVTRNLLANMPSEGPILNIACGTGQWSFLGWMATSVPWLGVDESAWAVEYARVTYGAESLRFYHTDMLAHLEPGTFEHALLVDVGPIPPAYERYAREIPRLLKPGGKLFLAQTQKTDAATESLIDEHCDWEEVVRTAPAHEAWTPQDSVVLKSLTLGS